jgi:hypothetical protein
MTDPVHSISIMIALLLAGTAYIIYWVLTYDDRDPS